MTSSTTPSVKYACSGSPLMLSNGNTAIDGLSGRGRMSEVFGGGVIAVEGVGGIATFGATPSADPGDASPHLLTAALVVPRSG